MTVIFKVLNQNKDVEGFTMNDVLFENTDKTLCEEFLKIYIKVNKLKSKKYISKLVVNGFNRVTITPEEQREYNRIHEKIWYNMSFDDMQKVF